MKNLSNLVLFIDSFTSDINNTSNKDVYDSRSIKTSSIWNKTSNAVSKKRIDALITSLNKSSSVSLTIVLKSRVIDGVVNEANSDYLVINNELIYFKDIIEFYLQS